MNRQPYDASGISLFNVIAFSVTRMRSNIYLIVGLLNVTDHWYNGISITYTYFHNFHVLCEWPVKYFTISNEIICLTFGCFLMFSFFFLLVCVCCLSCGYEFCFFSVGCWNVFRFGFRSGVIRNILAPCQIHFVDFNSKECEYKNIKLPIWYDDIVCEKKKLLEFVQNLSTMGTNHNNRYY